MVIKTGFESRVLTTVGTALALVAGLIGTRVLAQVPGALWDGFIVVRGQLHPDGTALACRERDAVVFNGRWCSVPGFLKADVKGTPELFSLDELMRLRLAGTLPPNITPTFVGVGPGFKEGGGKVRSVEYAEDRFVIYYKLTRS